MVQAPDDFYGDLRHRPLHRRLKPRPLIAGVRIKLEQERKSAKQGRHQQGAAIAILDVGAMHDGVNQEALRIDEDMPLLALDLLARIIAMRVDTAPPFSAALTLWLSMIAAVGLASRPACSRHFA
jgi:hypothetical protein